MWPSSFLFFKIKVSHKCLGAGSSGGESAPLIWVRSDVRVVLGPPFSWGISSAGRAPDLHSGGQRFDPAILHHFDTLAFSNCKYKYQYLYPIVRKDEQSKNVRIDEYFVKI